MSDEEFAGAEDSDYVCSDAEDEDFVFKCDKDLPERGVLPETKTFLLQCYDSEGGIDKCGWSSKLTKSLCDKHPDKLGAEGSILQSRVQTLADHWKRSNNKSSDSFQKIRTNVLKNSATSSSKRTKKTAPTPPRNKTTKKVASPVPPATTPPPKKKYTCSPAIGSPIMFGVRSRTISKKFLCVCIFCCVLLHSHHHQLCSLLQNLT